VSDLVLVVGVGRSGTSLFAGILGQLGFHIPQPEVQADETNPRGFGEPRWVVDFHRRLMSKRRVTVFDARPAAFDATADAARDPETVAELTGWLRGELAHGDRVVVKDPRIGWFLPLWERCAAEAATTPSFVTMLRHPAEILGSARRSYGDWQTDASRAASWLNVMLRTERATRDAQRAFVRYEDLLRDWRGEIARLPFAVDQARAAAVDQFVDPSLYRSKVSWADHAVPASVRELCEATWEALQREDRPVLDALLGRYDELYAEAEAISQSSVTAVRPRKRRTAKPAAPPSLRVRLARKVPKGVRDRLRGRS
jgi:hypothetical protein